MIIWRLVNNIDAKRDIHFDGFIGIDASTKGPLDNYNREWPGDVLCTQNVLEGLQEKGLLDMSDEAIRKWQLI